MPQAACFQYSQKSIINFSILEGYIALTEKRPVEENFLQERHPPKVLNLP
jgi:hypothetical protein